MTQVDRKLHVERGSRKQNVVTKTKSVASTVGKGHIQRISKLMALAIWFEELLNQEVVESQTALAELVHVSQPRMSQIMNLLLLAPEIQERLLFLPKVTGKDVVTEKMLRKVVEEMDWVRQRESIRMLNF